MARLRTPEQLARIAGNRLQQIEDRLGDRNLDERIRFPRGVINTAEFYRKRYPGLPPTLRTNVAYTMQLQDVLRWLANRFDLGLTAKEMLIKHQIVLLCEVMEGLAYAAVDELTSSKSNKRFKKNIDKLCAHQVISESLCRRLHRARELRDNIHLVRIRRKEYRKYRIRHYNKSLTTLRKLRRAISKKRAPASRARS